MPSACDREAGGSDAGRWAHRGVRLRVNGGGGGCCAPPPGQDWDRFDPVWSGYNGSKSLQTGGNGASDEAEQGRM